MTGTFDYAEVVIKTCTGDEHTITFDEDIFRIAKARASQAAAILDRIATDGDDLGLYKGKPDPGDWFQSFPSYAHITLVAVNKVNRTSEVRRLFHEREYTCDDVIVAQ